MPYRIAQFCLLSQIVIAPLMLGGARPWALGILSVLTGIGLVAICLPGREKTTQYIPLLLRLIWGGTGVIALWALLQSLPVWPMQAPPFAAQHIALYPDAWQVFLAGLLWLSGAITLGLLVCHRRPESFMPMVGKTLVTSAGIQVSLAALAACADWQTTFWFAKQAHIGDWTGSFANRNAFATFTGLGILACLYLFAKSPVPGNVFRQLDRAGGWLALAVLFGAAVLQSHSRSGVVITILAVIIFVIARRPATPPRCHLRFAAGAVLALLLIGVTILFAVPELAERFAELARPDLIQRDDAWTTAIHAILARPLAGYGPGSIALVMGHFATPGLNADAAWFSSHNLWFDGAIMFGLPVTGLMAAGMIAAIWSGLSRPARLQDRALLAAVICLLFASSLVDWVMALPALVLPAGLIRIGCLSAGAGKSPAIVRSADHGGQSGQPDQDAAR